MKTERDLEQANWYSEARVVQRLRKARYLVGRPRADGVVRCYLAGPMTDMPDYNQHAFKVVENVLIEAGWVVFNPADPKNDLGPEAGFRACLTPDIEYIMQRADVVFVQPGWEWSKGARLEVFIALQCDIPVFSYPGVRPIGMGEWHQAYEEATC